MQYGLAVAYIGVYTAYFLSCSHFISYLNENLLKVGIKRKIKPVAYQDDVVASLACAAAYYAFEDCSRLGAFGGAYVDAVVLNLHVFLCRMLVQSVSACDDALLYRIR